MKKDMPLEGLRWSRDSGSALYDTPQTAVLGRAGGVPARFLKTARPWTEEQPYKDEVERCEKLKRKMNLNI